MIDRVTKKYKGRKASPINKTREAAVLLLLENCHDGQVYVIFERRALRMKSQPGDICLPGGRVEDELPIEAALRECDEEIGLRSEDVEVLGELDDAITVTSNYIVTPFVAQIPWPYPFRINQDEVDEIIEIPIPALLDSNCRYQDTEMRDGEEVNAYTYHYRERVIWGATARILDGFLDIYKHAMTDG